jgi:hypothetical protein
LLGTDIQNKLDRILKHQQKEGTEWCYQPDNATLLRVMSESRKVSEAAVSALFPAKRVQKPLQACEMEKSSTP